MSFLMWHGLDEMKKQFAFELLDVPSCLNFALAAFASLLEFLKYREACAGLMPLRTPVLRQYATEFQAIVVQLMGAALMDDDKFLLNRETPLWHTFSGVLEESLDVEGELKLLLFSAEHWFCGLNHQQQRAAERLCRAAASSLMALFEGFDGEYLLPEKIARCLFKVIEKMDAWNRKKAAAASRKKRRCFRRTFMKKHRNSAGRIGSSH